MRHMNICVHTNSSRIPKKTITKSLKNTTQFSLNELNQKANDDAYETNILKIAGVTVSI